MPFHIIGTTAEDYAEHDEHKALHGGLHHDPHTPEAAKAREVRTALETAHIQHHNVLHDLCESGRAIVDHGTYTRLMQNAEAASRPTMSPKPAPHGDKFRR